MLRKFGLADQVGGRLLPRVYMAYRGPNKQEFLSSNWSMTMHGALPEYGQLRKASHQVGQQELAAACGIARSTFTRHVSIFAPPSEEEWTGEERRRHGDRMRRSAIARGLKALERPRRLFAKGPDLINRKRNYSSANSYSYRLPEYPDPKKPEQFRPPRLKQLLEDPRLAHLWDPDAQVGGYKEVPKFVWDTRVPLGRSDRMVLTYYILQGLLERGTVNPRQSTIARALGISVETVRAANGRLAKLGLIRVAHPKPIIVAGQMKRGPCIIIWVPGKILGDDQAVVETNRLLAQADKYQLRSRPEFLHALDLHAATLRGHLGQERSIKAFWRELQRVYAAAGIARELIQKLIPQPPN